MGPSRVAFLVVVLLIWCGRAGATVRARVELRAVAQVTRSGIFLADLLPARAPRWLHAAGAAIFLGFAPQTGSVRIFDSSEIVKSIATRPQILRQISVPDRVTVTRKSWPIEPGSMELPIREFFAARGWNADDLLLHAVELPGHAVALSEKPALEVRTAAWDSRSQVLQLFLRCVDRAQCANFLVLAKPKRQHVPGGRAELAFGARVHPRNANLELPENRRSGQLAQPALMHPGQTAELVLEGQGIQISMPVVCLESGVLGQQVRVRDAGSQRVFHAEIVGAGLVRAAF